jgi:hypothetical protein
MVNVKPFERITSKYELIRTAELLGSFFFKPDTMRSFGSRVLEGIYYTPGESTDHGYFITSEQDNSYGPLGAAWGGERRYTVRSFTITRDYRKSDGRPFDEIDIDSVSKFGEYASARAARRAAEFVAGIK